MTQQDTSPPERITPQQLLQLLARTDLPEDTVAKYLILDEDKAGPFSPQVQINPELIDAPPEEAKSALLLNILNGSSRMRRHKKFYDKVGAGYTGPIIVSEGDSWFQYPFILDDVIDVLMKQYAIWSLDAGGDTLENMIKEGEYLKAINEFQPQIFLLSAGGNDMVGGGALDELLCDYDPKRTPAQHLRPGFDAAISQAFRQFDGIFRRLEPLTLHIICHGYDYASPHNGRWLGKPMQKRGITDASIQKAIAKEMVDRFNTGMLALTAQFPQVTYLDNRGSVGTRWHDELHPTNAGYAAIASSFAAAIQSVAAATGSPLPQGAKSAPPATAGGPPPPGSHARRKGLSLHIGLNYVDPQHYAGWDGKLNACEQDATDMQDIALSQGYTPTLLLRGQATRKAVLEALDQAAQTLTAGDIFLLTYSGHGSQVPDYNDDESDDNLDETWCLFDGELIDDELFMRWARFRDGVRIVVVSDSCHSGTVIKATADGQRMQSWPVEDPNKPETWIRCMPPDVAMKTFQRNRAFYAAIGKACDSTEKFAMLQQQQGALACTVQLLAGCQDRQYSMDGPYNGAFTARLLRVWNEGHFRGSYSDFLRRIRAGMPDTQLPNHMIIGKANSVFVGQKPFEI